MNQPVSVCPDNARLQARTIFELVISEKKSLPEFPVMYPE
jgi:hypothetical protein